jgi:hypothetical protein
MEIETGARRMLLLQPSVIGYVGMKVFKNELLEHVQGTSGRALVVRKAGGWAPPETVQSSEFPQLVVECWADPDREPNGDKARDNAVDKAYALYRVVDPLFHRIRDVVWGAGGGDRGVRVITSMRAFEPQHSLVNYPRAGSNTPLQECAVVTATYNVHL